MFESGVNPEGIQTMSVALAPPNPFESGVNPEGIQTESIHLICLNWFESGVNPEGIQTKIYRSLDDFGLRVV